MSSTQGPDLLSSSQAECNGLRSDEERAVVVELASVGSQSDFQQAMLVCSAPEAQLRGSLLVSTRVPADTTISHGIWDQGRGSTELFQVQEKKLRMAEQEETWLWVRSGLSLAPPVVTLGTVFTVSSQSILVLSKQRSIKTLGLNFSLWCPQL